MMIKVLNGHTWQSLDSISVKAPQRESEWNKRHILTDQKGITLPVSITGSNIHDMKAINTLDTTIVQRSYCKQNLCLDKGYDFAEIERDH
jgi:hypothetical protein